MKNYSLTQILLTAAVFTFTGASATVVFLSCFAASGHPIARRLGLNSYEATQINFEELPGTYAERIAFLAKVEPASGLGYPAVNGLVAATNKASLVDIAAAPISFFHGHQQPLTIALVKTVMLTQIADRVLKENEHPDRQTAEAIAKLLDQTEEVTNSLEASLKSENTWGLHRLSSDSSTQINVTVVTLRQAAIQAVQKLRAS